MAAFEYIKESELVTTYEDAKKYMAPLHAPFDEYERIAANKPHPSIAKNLPKVTDGTLAALIQEEPKRVIQQIPTGSVVKASDWLDIVATFIVENEIIPNSHLGGALIQKCWALVSKAKTYGSQPAFVQFINRGEYFGTDFTLPYIKDRLLEPGKLSGADSKVQFLRTWWSKSDISKIIYKEKMLERRAKERGEKYESGWNLAELEKLKDEVNEKPQESQTMTERKKGKAEGFIEIDHCFQEGVGACFYSFSPVTKAVVRKKVSKDPRGIIPIHDMYANLDFSNPLGKGGVEMAGGIQNLLDSEMQMYQYNRALMLNPPLKKWGNMSSSSLKMAPNAIWDMGANKSIGDVEPVEIDTSAIANFASNHGLLRSQILNLFAGGGDTSISADVGSPGFSKTDAGVNALQEKLGVSDNYTRKQFESTFEDIMETSINLYFAERSGIQELELDAATALKLKAIAPVAVGGDNKIEIDYDTETAKLKFQIDASSSSVKDNSQQLEAIGGLLERLEASPMLSQIVPPEKVKEAWNKVVTISGVEDAEDLMIETKDEQGNPIEDQPQEPQMTPEMVQEMIQQGIQEAMAQKPQPDPLNEFVKAWGIKFTDLPEDAQRQLLAEAGVESAEEMPAAHDRFLKEADMELKTEQAMHGMEKDAIDLELRDEQQQHSMTQAEASHQLSASDAAIRIKQANEPKETASTKAS